MTRLVHFDDLDKINVPFGLLDDDTQERLRAHGGPYEFLSGWRKSWAKIYKPVWNFQTVYRVAPSKPHPLVVKDWAMIKGNFVARDEDGHICSYEAEPIQESPHGADGYWADVGAGCWTLDGCTEALIDPGDCDWTEAIDCRDDPNNAKRGVR